MEKRFFQLGPCGLDVSREKMKKIGLILLLVGCSHYGDDIPSLPMIQAEQVSKPKPILTPAKPKVKYELSRLCKDSEYVKALEKAKHQKIASNQNSKRQKKRQLKRYQLEILRGAESQNSTQMASFPLTLNSRVDNWIQYFLKNGRTTYLKWLARSEGVRPVIMDLLEKEGMPKELFFLAMIESGFNATAKSHARAVGTWQFMRPTALHYGLKINHFIDERRDPVKSTIAASRFLRDLYGRFKNWHLAIAAYNAGPGTIRKATRRLKTKSFWVIANSRYLRRETKNYVPKMIAATIIGMNPEKYGFHIINSKPYTLPNHYVSLNRPVFINEVAGLLGLSNKQLKKWNPELVHEITPPIQEHFIGDKKHYSLRIPDSYADSFYAQADLLSELKVNAFSMYKVRKGDTLSQIAKRHRIKLTLLLKVNPKVSAKSLRIGSKLAVPVPGVDKVRL